jgi:hypothetical protein
MSTLREFYKEQYQQEAARRQALMGSLTFPLGILTLVVGAQSIVVKSITAPLDGLAWMEIVLMALSGAQILVASGFLIRAYFGYKYGYIPTASELQKYSSDLADYYVRKGMSPDNSQTRSEAETLAYIDTQFAVVAGNNSKNNDAKTRYLFFANAALIGSIIFFIIGSLPYVWSSINAGPIVQKVEVINLRGGLHGK